ncbi:MAG: anhydro-N-acetylmuramic acid kinase [Rhodospirillaceae bacterium]|nr:anhydro-N-acetylmuramic acid kinase [Rhodospirillaceae bacterium]MBT5458122.1 anhydro-N-acetylmuramic acid kinase [Rhodospirillaceae bacterium]
MSGTSMDGIDAALLRTDGQTVTETGLASTTPYDSDLRNAIRGILGGVGAVDDVERRVTEAHAAAVTGLLAAANLSAADIDIIGFHGHTILHRPQEGRTWQIGDGGLLARLTGIDVVCDLRSNDVAKGGEGAPIVPVYHRALCGDLPRPLAIVNIGGVANVTWIGMDDEMLAFDTGPGNGLLDEWVDSHIGEPFDKGGKLAGAGQSQSDRLVRLLENPYFDQAPPKSLDRIDFDLTALEGLRAADGAATLVAFTAETIARAKPFLPALPNQWLVTGGGRHNPTLMAALEDSLGMKVAAVETVGWNGDALEAQAFAFLAARSLLSLPLTYPGTTGVSAPVTGGRFFAHSLK